MSVADFFDRNVLVDVNNPFFEKPVLNSPYGCPTRHWELDPSGQPTQRIIESRRRAEFITPIPKPQKRRGMPQQASLVFDEGKGLSTAEQRYAHTAVINSVRQHVNQWRRLPNPNEWRVTPETARLLQHWRHHEFSDIRPFFCQIEAVETAIWLTEVAPQIGKVGEGFLEHLANANNDANPGLIRLALKLATGAGKTTVMAMLIAWQTINAVRHPQSKRFTRGFLVVAPGLTIKDRLRVLQPNDPDSYYADVLGIPFDFNAKPVLAPPQPPRETIQVRAVRPERDALEIRFPRVEGYRAELPEERLTARFNEDSVLELTSDLVGATETRNSGIIGETVDLNLVHTGDVRPSQVVYELTSHLLMTRWRDGDGQPQLHLFGQLKRIVKQWLDEGGLVCQGGTYPAQLKYKMLADMACERIMAGITRELVGKRPIKAVLDSYNPVGSTAHVRFNTSKADRWETDSRRCHVNWVVLDSDWEAEFCRVAEGHPRVRAYVKNHNLGLEVPYRCGSETRRYLPDFIVLVDDGHGDDDLLHLVVEIKGYRREDAKDKKATMETYWVPGVNNLGAFGRWAFAEFTEVYRIEADFAKKVETEFDRMVERFATVTAAT